MKTIAALIAATALSGCTPAAMLAAEVAAEAALILIEDTGKIENLGVMTEEACEVTARSLNKAAWSGGQQIHHVCVPAEAITYDVIMGD